MPAITGTIESSLNTDTNNLEYTFIHNKNKTTGKLNTSETGDFYIPKKLEEAYFFIIPLGPLDYYWHATFSIFNKSGILYTKKIGYIGDINERKVRDIKLGKIKLNFNKVTSGD